MMTPQTTEDGETWLKDTSALMAKTTIPVQRVTLACPQIGTHAGEPKNAQPADEKPTQENTETAELTPTAPPMKEETVPVQAVEETTTETVLTEAVEVQAVQTQNIEQCQINLQPAMVSKFFAVLKPVVTAVTQQITNKTPF